MEAKEEISYYLIEHPFKNKKTIVFDREGAFKILNEDTKLKKVLHVSQKTKGQKEKALVFERSLIENSEKKIEKWRGLVVFLCLVSLAPTYLFFPILFNFGYLPTTRYLTENLNSITPEIVNRYLNFWAQIAPPVIGTILGFLPPILALAYLWTHAPFLATRSGKRYIKLLKDLKKQDFRIFENEKLLFFSKESKNLIKSCRREAEILRISKAKSNRIKACQKIKDLLEKIAIVARIHKLDAICYYFNDLYQSFYHLERRLIKRRFWQNNEKILKKLLGNDFGKKGRKKNEKIARKLIRRISKKKPIILGAFFGFLVVGGTIFCSGFYILDDSEVAIVVEYRIGDLFGENFRADLVAIINKEHSGGTYKIVRYEDSGILAPFGKVFWHLPWPFGKHHKISLKPHDFQLRSQLIFEIARDQEGRPLMYALLTSDVDGNSLTDDPGFKFISAHDLFAMRFDPEAEMEVMILDVKGSFEIVDLEKYAVWLKDSYSQMDKLIERLGFYAEIAKGPYGDNYIETYLSYILPTLYVWRIRFPTLLEKANKTYPWLPIEELVSIVAKSMIENPEIMTNGFIEFLKSAEFIEMAGLDFKKDVGIEFSKEITTKIYTETF